MSERDRFPEPVQFRLEVEGIRRTVTTALLDHERFVASEVERVLGEYVSGDAFRHDIEAAVRSQLPDQVRHLVSVAISEAMQDRSVRKRLSEVAKRALFDALK